MRKSRDDRGRAGRDGSLSQGTTGIAGNPSWEKGAEQILSQDFQTVPAIWILDCKPPELSENAFLLFWAIQFTVLHYRGLRKQTQVVRVLYILRIFGILSPYHIHGLQIIFPILGVVFSLSCWCLLRHEILKLCWSPIYLFFLLSLPLVLYVRHHCLSQDYKDLVLCFLLKALWLSSYI